MSATRSDKKAEFFEEYFQDLFRTFKAGDATELSFYADLKKLLEEFSGEGSHVTTNPKRTEAGNPDFRVFTKKGEIVGYVEAKPPTATDLDEIEDSEQLKRYREAFPNLILTNFFEFRLYRDGKLTQKVLLGRPFVMHELRLPSPVEHSEDFVQLLEKFFSFSTPRVISAKMLAIELAKRTRFLRDQVIIEELKAAMGDEENTLYGFYRAFKEHLIESLSVERFADLYAQTITYGLFAARMRCEEDFNREIAHRCIPPTAGILRDLFRYISSKDIPVSMAWIVDDIAEVLAVADVKKIMERFYAEGKGRDPVVHFYETFLAEYDPKERERMGVYYTPEPIVGYIIRSVHALLKEHFAKEDGFATPSVTVLDPAAGTLTFPAEAMRLAVEEFKSKYGDGGLPKLVKEHFLEHFYAFELMMAPYAIGHLKINFVLQELGYELSGNEKFRLFLTNTLDFRRESHQVNTAGVMERSLARESQEALKVKEEAPIMVIIGNPPYSGVSENKGEWILKQIENYKYVDGKPLGERKTWLQDDYVKFFRFAQWKIEQNGQGILGFITNHAWLDNPTFRGMRQSLMRTFDDLYVLDLHGSTLKKEKTPSGGKDENVFSIQAGVAISLFVKRAGNTGKKRVFHAEQFGLREKKYEWLEKHDFTNTKWTKLEPTTPYYFFVPREEKGREKYESYPKITDIFPVNSTGVLTARDEFVTDFNRQSLEARIRIFVDPKNSDEQVKQMLNLRENYAWRVSQARKTLQEEKDLSKYYTKILYRPFDEREIFFHPAVVWRTRTEVMQHMLRPNLALCIGRAGAVTGNKIWDIVSCSGLMTDFNLYRRGGNLLFPLYLYSGNQPGQKNLLEVRKVGKKISNISDGVLESLKKNFSRQPAAEDILYYIYAILYSPTYRKRYEEFLKIDFPRIPFTDDEAIFKKLAGLGERLVQLHLLKSPELNAPIVKFFGKDGGMVKARKFRDNRVYINDEQYFDGVTPEMWKYQIGGYQVLDKWLKDRKGRALSSEDIKHYCRVATVIAKTIELQDEIDKLTKWV
ncbi:DNA methyltransferase [Candidatus Uhrbacteria bacterium RIFCSPHIGHO2_02_FULL_57_19]|uniref:site-specific DNA-methyltransferase (adenine-specific) n=2 Tax=Candidatus Uhriibacteriota TaxID=1752732 RepID=A0A1F7U2G2_9BACT|nr:MAG: DNA methyltransferase [Candidatus Uhrbacteria bacterium RIFCSPHIGHO2_02_FULL_57_19]